MPEFDRLSKRIMCIDLSFVERDRALRWAIEVGILGSQRPATVVFPLVVVA